LSEAVVSQSTHVKRQVTRRHFTIFPLR